MELNSNCSSTRGIQWKLRKWELKKISNKNRFAICKTWWFVCCLVWNDEKFVEFKWLELARVDVLKRMKLYSFHTVSPLVFWCMNWIWCMWWNSLHFFRSYKNVNDYTEFFIKKPSCFRLIFLQFHLKHLPTSYFFILFFSSMHVYNLI